MTPNSILRLLFALCLACPFAARAEAPRLDLLVSEDAVYRVGFEQLAEHGLSPLPAERLSLHLGDEAIPFWLEGLRRGQFGPGSSIVFAGQHRRGAETHFHETSRQNVYRLRFEGLPGKRGKDLGSTSTASPESAAVIRRHLQEDRIRVRFAPFRVPFGSELWYWQRLSVLDREPFELPVDLGLVSAHPEHPVALRVNFRGWSFTHPPGEIPDHRVEVVWNGEAIAAAEWSGQQSHTTEVIEIPRHLLRDGENRLQLKVPARRSGPEDNLIPDISLLNWIELDHAFDGVLEPGQLVLRGAPEAVDLQRGGRLPVALYSMDGERVLARPGARRLGASFTNPEQDVLLLVGDAKRPDSIRIDTPSSLRDPERQADYLMISHHSLIDSIAPLAEFHRSRGLSVEVVDVQDIYDEFSHGHLAPEAIRDFLSYAYHQRRAPAPRFVLLVGDASWENHGGVLDDSNYADWTFQQREIRAGRFSKNTSTSYADLSQSRNLVPTLLSVTGEGPAASDSMFVEVDGDDWKPDMAIGRLPVVKPEEVDAIVRKLIAYETEAPVGPWRRSMLWIGNDETRIQRITDAVAMGATEQGMRPVKVYPDASAPDNSQYQGQLIDELNDGRLLVHFFGHGGRYIWRTGPPDPKKNHDLFTLDHLDQLSPNSRLPIVLSMTCYSAPFDHPTADSIGEKFLRSDGRGAVGVLAASWRNEPTQPYSKALVEALLERDTTVGEAIMAAKRQTHNRILVQTYNYLGDPATRLSLPAQEIGPRMSLSADRSALDMDLSASDLGAGRILVDLFDDGGNLLASREFAPGQRRFQLSEVSPEAAAVAAYVSAYVWDEGAGVDGMGRIGLPRAEADVAQAARR